MAAGLIGISVAVTLQNPPNTVVQGIVAAVNPQTATLTLQDVLFPATGHRLDGYNVEGHAIADIKVNSPPTAPPPPQPQRHQPPQHHAHVSYPPPPFHQAPAPAAAPAPPPAQQPFQDPAILSVNKRSTAPSSSHPIAAPPQEAPATPIKPISSATAVPLPATTSPFVGVAKKQNVRKPSAATLEGPFSSLDIADAEEPDSDDAKTRQPGPLRRASVNKTRSGKPMEDITTPGREDSYKRTRRGGKARKKEVAAQEKRKGADLNGSPDVVRKGKGTGWRQTPMLQDAEQPQERTPGVIGGRVGLEAASASNRKTRKQRALEAKNGWATEDATDIQELPEFDFLGNLSKFDKRSVFDQIRNEDTTADEDRLVSFNRLARPGTHGGKNLHPTENVLESRRLKSTTNTDSEDDDMSEFESGRTSRRAMSRTSHKRAPTRQGSGVLQPDIDAVSHNSGAPPSLVSRASRAYINRPYASSHATGSPKPGRIATPPDSPLLDPSAVRSCLRLVSSNRKCHTITPGGMLAVEESAEVDFGLTEDMMAENAGRGIAEVALSAINPGGRRLARDNPNSRPVIVVLAGNHRGGARAVAAARQLQARGPKVMVALLGFERAADWDRDVRRQVDLFKKFGGSVRAWPQTEDALKRLQAPPELIIDALLGRHKEFDALGDEDRRTVLAIVGWANKSRAACLAVETPSGVGGSTGEVAILEGEPLEVRAKYIVCLGAPRSGLLKALQNGTGRDPQWLIWVVDIGVNRPWRNAGIGGGGGKGVKFGENWIVQIKYAVEGEGDGEGIARV
ncbi:YjeF N-terminal domain-like protein [Aaosphaeria arxii CBS 175.79]|uniref:Enhancer of mRNA-decapping protein 3 n=1 Tax=Aaosphaeria arxii CBS 175.79 TaxID=1450172 RepID=A0A6A5XPZ6_9PLEO|nr:YjeF N-terminal domain-like protein [Aaosphaeria arxii CBS 175.79]KAF2015013.1 YjeF N-terminal domain-like protein [Aaosphaeria arxii CBS 175.79]